ncbi:hypothetical protein GOX2614 (plasmid) [Gluconobacter oxydans 621H]|uniref:Uncharacterized protein n=1 Tax=Gluconobacter oxydans (strain 621H) TaxID=290633 RepID=Q5HXS5_GLUOX|nr:hypothetical protein GOX2614 [Gluconobacter oxydans 621H]
MPGLSRRQEGVGNRKTSLRDIPGQEREPQKSDCEPCKNGMGVFLKRGRGHFPDSAAFSTNCCKNTQFPKNDHRSVTFCDASG